MPVSPPPTRLPATRGADALRAARRGAPRLAQRVFTVLCAAAGVVLGLVAYAVAVGLGVGASVDGAALAAVIGGVALALASRTVAARALARALGLRALWLTARLVVRRFGIPL